MVGHKPTELFCPGSATRPQTGILCSTASISANISASTEGVSKKEAHSRRSELFACEWRHRACRRPEPTILLESVPGKKDRW